MPECILVLFVPHPNKYPYGIRKDLAAQLRTLPIYILVVPTIKDFVTQLMWLVFLQTIQIQDIIRDNISISGPFVPAHTNGPHVSYATRVTYMQFPTYITVHYRDDTQKFNAEWAALHTSPRQRIHFLYKSPYGTLKGTRVPRYTVMANCITSLHLVTLPYEMAVITITR